MPLYVGTFYIPCDNVATYVGTMLYVRFTYHVTTLVSHSILCVQNTYIPLYYISFNRLYFDVGSFLPKSVDFLSRKLVLQTKKWRVHIDSFKYSKSWASKCYEDCSVFCKVPSGVLKASKSYQDHVQNTSIWNMFSSFKISLAGFDLTTRMFPIGG
jgi:hypothetical protein